VKEKFENFWAWGNSGMTREKSNGADGHYMTFTFLYVDSKTKTKLVLKQ